MKLKPRQIFSLLACSALLSLSPLTTGAESDKIQLLVRGDDMGVCHAINEACIKSFRDGMVRSVEIIVPGPWFLDAVKLIRENPGLDAGVHLCLTSEWERCKWRPLTHAPSLADADGYFFPMTNQRQDFPPNTSFLGAKPKLDEVERELRAQIELAKKHLPNISHVSAHMGTATATSELRALTKKLAEEYHLRLDAQGLKSARGFTGKTPNERETSLVALLEKLEPGLWLLVEHPGFDVPEMRALGHHGYENVAEDREGVTQAFTSAKVAEVIRRRSIKLINYAELPKP